MIDEKLDCDLDDRRCKYNSGYGYESYEETTELWVADFGSQEAELALQEELAKLKKMKPKYFSWILATVILLIIVVLTEFIIRQIAMTMFWPEMVTFWTTWLWRLVLLIIWLYLAKFKLKFNLEKIFVITTISFVLGVIISAVVKIIYIKSAWTWLNLLTEPVWMILVIALVGFLFVKYIYKIKK